MIHESYFSVLRGERPHISVEGLSEEEQKHHSSEHVGHCFDYLRQAIMCAGDLTVEWAREEEVGIERFTVDGWGVEHVCQDWSQAFDWVRANRAPKVDVGIV
jgi:hypothetical protein